MSDDDLRAAHAAERLGDDAAAGQDAAAHYREAQRLLMPPGVVWTDCAAYDLRMEAFERIQQKLYHVPATASATPAIEAPVPEAPAIADPLPPASPQLSVGEFYPGLVVRVAQDFIDYDGQQIHTGEILHFLDGSYFPYESGHTLIFAEKTIRIAGIVEEHEPIIANAGNAWFQLLAP